MISKQDFNERVIAKLQSIADLFENKNDQYGDDDPLANFTRGALIRYGELNMETRYEALKDYVLKHISHVYNNGLYGAKVDESINDIAVYFIIASVMHDLKDVETTKTMREIETVEELKSFVGEDVFVMFKNNNGSFYKVELNLKGEPALAQSNIILTLDYLASIDAHVFELNI